MAGLALAASSAAFSPAVSAMPATGATPVQEQTQLGVQAHHASGQAKTVRVKGTQTLVDLRTGKYEMHGDLVGKWTMVPTETLHKSPTLYVESGLEKFIGCIDTNLNRKCGRREPSGEMRLAYLYWVSFDAKGKLIKGQCVHPVTGGNKSFKGARGVLNMYDRPDGNGVRTTYKGKIRLNAVRSDPPLPTLNSTLSATAASAPRRAC
jgi:hypothetical protein